MHKIPELFSRHSKLLQLALQLISRLLTGIFYPALFLVTFLLIQPSCASHPAENPPHFGDDELYRGFQNPGSQARPFVRWWWNGNAVTEKEIIREIELLEKAGIGGVEINPIAMPSHANAMGSEQLEWLSPGWNEMVHTAAEASGQRDMYADLIVGSGWPFGGKFLKPDQTIKSITLNKRSLTGPADFEAEIKDLVKPPDARHAPSNMPEPELLFVRLCPVIAAGRNDFVDLTDSIYNNKLKFDVPAGKYNLYVAATWKSIRTVLWGAPGADGPVLDHFNSTAVEDYLNRMSEKLSHDIGGSPGKYLRAMFCDSIELAGANWASDLPTEFQKRCGYRLQPYLHLILDHDLPRKDTAAADTILRMRYDFCKTLVELFHERFIKTFHGWSHRNRTLSRYQAYGIPFLMGMLDGYRIPDIPEGDIWLFNKDFPPIDGIRYAVWNKYAASGGHMSGSKLIGSEAMTNTKGVFRATLEYIKQATDLSFITGVNHLILHGFNYSPPEAGFPGWVRYGTYFSEQNTWWPYFPRWVEYAARISYLLQQTTPATQVAILGPTADVWSRHGLSRPPFIKTPWYLHRLWQALHNNGCSADYISESDLQEAVFDKGEIQLGPARYKLLILTNVRTLQPETAEAIRCFADENGKIIFTGCKPNRSPAMKNAAENDKRVVDSINHALDSHSSNVRVVEQPEQFELIQWVRKTLREIGVEPQVEISDIDPKLYQIHHYSDVRDIFFLTNLNRSKKVSFEAEFNTNNKTPWQWNPETGERIPYPYSGRRDKFSICLEPLHSILLVFEPGLACKPRKGPEIDVDNYVAIGGPWQVRFEHTAGKTFSIKLKNLIDFSGHSELKDFAGTATYRTFFDLQSCDYCFLDLGDVRDISEVVLNGVPLGIRWYGPHIYEIGDILVDGRNTLKVKVTNTVYNYCLSLKANPVAQRWVRGKYPIPSGLIGPVRVHKAR